MRSRVWLGDMIRAVASVTPVGESPDPVTIASVARLLGCTDFGPVDLAAPQADRPETTVKSPGSAGPAVSAAELPEGELPAGTAKGPEAGAEREYRPDSAPRSGLRETWQEEKEPSRPWAEAVVLKQATLTQLRRSPPYIPLFRRTSTAAIVHALLARQLPDGDVDIAALVECLATGRPVTSVPRLAHPSLRFGAHVLLDRSESMFQFHRDQQHLVRVIDDVVGTGMTKVGTCLGTPQRVRSGSAIPGPGRPVIVVSGFGIRSSDPKIRDWELFARRLRRQQSRLVALVPFPQHRWPTWLCRLMPVVAWDRTSTVGSVRAALDRAS